MRGLGWTKQKVQDLEDAINGGKAIKFIAITTYRTEKAIEAQISRMRNEGKFLYLKQLPTRKWLSHDDAFLTQAMNQCRMFHDVKFNPHIIPYMVNHTGRSISNIINRICSMQKHIIKGCNPIDHHVRYEAFLETNIGSLKKTIEELIGTNADLRSRPEKVLEDMISIMQDKVKIMTGCELNLPKDITDIFYSKQPITETDETIVN